MPSKKEHTQSHQRYNNTPPKIFTGLVLFKSIIQKEKRKKQIDKLRYFEIGHN